MDDAPQRLVELAKGGDRDAFGTLIRDCDAGMRALVFSVVRDRWLMDDVLQLAYEKAFRRIGGFRGDSSFRTWLHRVCWTTAVDVLRAEGRRRQVPLAEAETHPSREPGPASRAISRLTWDQAWSRLNDDHRAALTLVVAEGLSYEEAARVFGVRPGTVASRVSRGRIRLAELLGEAEAREGTAPGGPVPGGSGDRPASPDPTSSRSAFVQEEAE